MNNENIKLISPNILSNSGFSEAEILGAFVFLWSQNIEYRKSSIESAIENLMPIIKNKNFCLFIKNNTPLGYINWIYMNDNESSMYSRQEKDYVFYVEKFNSDSLDKKIWILTAFFPNGGVHIARNLLKNKIFKGRSVRFINKNTSNIQSYSE